MIARAYCDAPHGWTRRTKRSARYRAIGFVEAMTVHGVERPSEISDVTLDAWRTLLGKTRTAATINRGEDVVRKMLRWAAEQKPPLCAPTPMATRVRVREVEREANPLIPSPFEIALIVGALNRFHRGMALAVTVSNAVGFRLDEMREMDDRWIDDDGVAVRPERGPMATAWTSKGKRERKIPAAPAVIAAARELVEWRRENNWRMSDHSVADNLREALTMVPWGDTIPLTGMHDFRRAFATECIRHGISPTQVQEWLAHKSIRTTQRYLGRYRTDAALVVPTPPAVAVLAALAEPVPYSYDTPVDSRTLLRDSETSQPTPASTENSGNPAEEKRFELLEDFHPRRFSRPLHIVEQAPGKASKAGPRTLPRTLSIEKLPRFRAPNRKAR